MSFDDLQSDCIVVEPKEEPVLSDSELNEIMQEVSYFYPKSIETRKEKGFPVYEK